MSKMMDEANSDGEYNIDMTSKLIIVWNDMLVVTRGRFWNEYTVEVLC